MKKFIIVFSAILLPWIILTWCNTQKNSEDILNTATCESWSTCNIEELNTNDQNDEIINNKNTQTEPMMRKMVIDENKTPEELEEEMTKTCNNAWWNWENGECTLEDGTKIMF